MLKKQKQWGLIARNGKKTTNNKTVNLTNSNKHLYIKDNTMKATHKMKNTAPVREMSETKMSRKEAKKAQKLALKQARNNKEIDYMEAVAD